jgi:hypothetical protein
MELTSMPQRSRAYFTTVTRYFANLPTFHDCKLPRTALVISPPDEEWLLHIHHGGEFEKNSKIVGAPVAGESQHVSLVGVHGPVPGSLGGHVSRQRVVGPFETLPAAASFAIRWKDPS